MMNNALKLAAASVQHYHWDSNRARTRGLFTN